MAGDYEDVSVFVLSGDREAQLLRAQTECTFMWVTSTGDPVGVIMNYVWHADRFWLTATRRRKRIPAIERDPRVAIAISSRGTKIGVSQSITYKGQAVVHDDDATKQWFYPLLAATVRPDSETKQQAFAAHLDSPGRVVIEVVPTLRIGFDAEAMFANSDAGATTTML
jgi:general stress protein 26